MRRLAAPRAQDAPPHAQQLGSSKARFGPRQLAPGRPEAGPSLSALNYQAAAHVGQVGHRLQGRDRRLQGLPGADHERMPIRGSNPRITAQQQTGATVGKPANRGRAEHQLAGGSHSNQTSGAAAEPAARTHASPPSGPVRGRVRRGSSASLRPSSRRPFATPSGWLKAPSALLDDSALSARRALLRGHGRSDAPRSAA